MNDKSISLPFHKWIILLRAARQEYAAVRTMHSHDPVEEQKLRATEYELQELIQLLDKQLKI